MTPIFFPDTTLIYINKQNNKVEININGTSKIKKDSGTRNSLPLEKTAHVPIIPKEEPKISKESLIDFNSHPSGIFPKGESNTFTFL